MPVIDGDDGTLQFLSQFYGASGYLPVACGVGEESRKDYAAGLDSVKGCSLSVSSSVQTLDVPCGNLRDRLTYQVRDYVETDDALVGLKGSSRSSFSFKSL